jgi:hypothetical protein
MDNKNLPANIDGATVHVRDLNDAFRGAFAMLMIGQLATAGSTDGATIDRTIQNAVDFGIKALEAKGLKVSREAVN